MISISKIEFGVKKLLLESMGLREGEYVLVITDIPTAQDWAAQNLERLSDMTLRNLLAKGIVEVAARSISNVNLELYAYPSVGRNSAEPGLDVSERILHTDILLAVTTYSITHTEARGSATSRGVRVASMPGLLPEMLYPDGPIDIDYNKVASETVRVANLLSETSKLRLTSEAGTDLTMSVDGREGKCDTGIYTDPGSWGNLPAGEAYIAPVEGTGEGIVIIERGWHPRLIEDMAIHFRDGLVVKVEGGGDVGDSMRKFLRLNEVDSMSLARRNLAEFGIGTNPKAKRIGNILEAEKIRGTVHIALGDNSHIGGKVKADHHQDFIIKRPTVEADGVRIMEMGKLRLR
ncbi:MAG: aminopeptidase [Candidatus Bathyarchaeia archaeon]